MRSCRQSPRKLYPYAFTVDIYGKENLYEFQALINRYSDESLSELDAHNNIVSKFRVTNSNYSYTETEYLIRTRRHIHRYAEVNGTEHKTNTLIRAELDRAGIPYSPWPIGSGNIMGSF